MLLAIVGEACHAQDTFSFRLPLILGDRASDWNNIRRYHHISSTAALSGPLVAP